MKLFLNLILGVGISIVLFLLLLFGFNGEDGQFFIIAILIGVVLGMQIMIYNKIKNLK
ncbi:hypothetical protein SC499_12270 [Peribacillus simplex]|uniref:hypothetical protein n=1 Tax=Peribacillus simplex TaxID=1478 RepID=UPI00298E999A|nr:hypothetical protein [Peribacillus simplex]MDW7615477.1 hypothetical protein [Peribacillus simplex]